MSGCVRCGLPLDRPIPGRALRYLSMRPPLADGGHCFVRLDYDIGRRSSTTDVADVWWCIGCYRAVPGWALAEGFATTLLGRWCPALFRQLGPGPTVIGPQGATAQAGGTLDP